MKNLTAIIWQTVRRSIITIWHLEPAKPEEKNCIINLSDKDSFSNTKPDGEGLYKAKTKLEKKFFSVALLAVKYQCLYPHSNQVTNTFKVQNCPPMTAKLLMENESFEDFFTKNIKEAIKLHASFIPNTNSRSLSTSENQTDNQTREYFFSPPLTDKSKI